MNSKTFSGQVTYLENWRSSIFCTISCQQVSTFRCWTIFLIIWTIQGGIFFRFGDRWRRIRSTRRTTLSTYSTDLPKPKVNTQYFVVIITEPFSSSSPFRAARQAGYCAGCVRAGHRLALLSKSSYGRGKMGPGFPMVTPIHNPHAPPPHRGSPWGLY